MNKKLRKSSRGLTFSLDDNELIGTKYRYFIDKKNKNIIIIPDDSGNMTVSRKKSGKKFKALYDIRSKEVKELCSTADYLEVDIRKDKIIVHTYKKIAKKVKSNVIRLDDILEKTGEIILSDAVGFSNRSSLEENICTNTLTSKLSQIYNVASLFSGAGLLDYTFSKDENFNIVYGVDFDENACMTYKENIGDHIVCKDIRNVSPNEIPDINVCIGGPCCQGYSNENRHNENSIEALNKRLLIEDYIRIVKAKNPDVFVIENVPQLFTKDNGIYISKVFEKLSSYHISTAVIEDDKVGGYSTRKRAIIIGNKYETFKFPSIKLSIVHTVRDALSKVTSTWYNYNDVTKPSKSTIEKMSFVPQGGNWQDIPQELHKFKKSTHSSTYRRLSWDEPSPTITNWRKTNLLHPDENRILTVAEASAIMGLDKEFKVMGKSLNSKQQQIGNGVTQAISRYIKNCVLSILNKNQNIICFG